MIKSKPNKWRALLLVATVACFAAPRAVAEGNAATTLLERARETYANAGTFHETLEIKVSMPDGKTSSTRQDYGVGPDGSAFLRLTAGGVGGLRIVGVGDRAVGIWSRVEGRHVESEYAGNLARAMSAMEAGQLGLAAPPSVVAAQGGDANAFAESLRFGILQPITSMKVVPGTSGAIELQAANGRCVITVGAEARFDSLQCALGEKPNQIRAEGKFTFADGAAKDELTLPDMSRDLALPTLTKLEASEYPLGGDAPSVRLTSLDGRAVDLGAMRGKFVVLDFWATWCVPCWSALEQTEVLARWAETTNGSVVVFAVNSLERGSEQGDRRDKVRKFLADRNLELDVLLDIENKAFSAFHEPGLPSLIIIDREGRLADYHSGVLPDMASTVKTKIEELRAK